MELRAVALAARRTETLAVLCKRARVSDNEARGNAAGVLVLVERAHAKCDSEDSEQSVVERS